MANILHESARGIEKIAIEDEFLGSRRVFVCGEINDDSANELIKELIYLETDDASSPVTLFINSPGGSVSAGLAVYDTLRMMESPIRVVCTGLAGSIAAIIYLAGDKDKRYILPNSKIMVHDPSFSGGHDIGHRKYFDVEPELENLRKCGEKLASIISERTGKTLDEVMAITRYDTFFSAEEAIEFGLASNIVKSIKEVM